MADMQEEEVQSKEDPPESSEQNNAEEPKVGAAPMDQKSDDPKTQKNDQPPKQSEEKKNSPPRKSLYGPLAAKGAVNIAKKEPRIDPVKYQYSIPEKKTGVGGCDLDIDTDKNGVILWEAERLPEENVEEYLAFVQRLLPNKNKYFSEERSLFLLHLCEYDIRHAKQVLREKSSIQPSQTESDISESEESSEEKNSEPDLCFVCGDGGNLLICDSPNCNKVYHLHCVELEDVPKGSWQCKWHTCMICDKIADLRYACRYCPNSLCTEHGKNADLTISQQVEFLCKSCQEEKITPDNRFYSRLTEYNRRAHRKENIRNKKIRGHQISLYALFAQVAVRGGWEKVNTEKAWKEVHRALRLDSGVKKKQLQKLYRNSLLAYETHFHPPEPTLPLLQTRIGRSTGGVVDLTIDSPPKNANKPPPRKDAKMEDGQAGTPKKGRSGPRITGD